MKAISIEDLMKMWSDDCKIRKDDLSVESLKTPELHSKYLNILTYHNVLVKSINSEYVLLKKQMTEYYNGQLNTDQEFLKENGLEPLRNLVLKQDIPTYLESDPKLSKLLLKKAMHEEKVEYCKSVLKEIHNRNWSIRNAIEFEKFISGA